MKFQSTALDSMNSFINETNPRSASWYMLFQVSSLFPLKSSHSRKIFELADALFPFLILDIFFDASIGFVSLLARNICHFGTSLNLGS